MPSLAQRCGAEFIGTFFLVFIGVGSIAADAAFGSPGPMGISLSFGAVVAAMVYATGHISGAHLNPAVTLGFASAWRISLTDATAYVATQLLAAASAAWLLAYSVGLSPSVGVTTPSVPFASALIIEATLTFSLMFVIMAVATDERAASPLAGVAIGLAVAMGAMMGGPLTGASMNPARSFGPALATGEWTAHLLYWVAPCLGSFAAVRCYRLIGSDQPSRSDDPIPEPAVGS